MNVTLKQISCISSNIPGWFDDKKLREKRKPFLEEVGRLCIFDAPYGCVDVTVSHTPYAQSHFFLTLYDCVRLRVKSSLCPASSRDIKRGYLAEVGGALAHRIAAGITQGEMLLLQGWFRTIMEKHCGGFSTNHPDTRMHTHKAYIIYIWTWLEHIHKNNLGNTHNNVACVVGLDGGNTATHTNTYTWLGGR